MQRRLYTAAPFPFFVLFGSPEEKTERGRLHILVASSLAFPEIEQVSEENTREMSPRNHEKINAKPLCEIGN